MSLIVLKQRISYSPLSNMGLDCRFTCMVFIPPHTHTLSQRRGPSFSCLNHTVCQDDVDLTICFEDTAILYLICVSLWLLTGLEFLTTSRKTRDRIAFNHLNVSKIVSLLVQFLLYCIIVYYIGILATVRAQVVKQELARVNPQHCIHAVLLFS